MLTRWGGDTGWLTFDTWDQGTYAYGLRNDDFNKYTPLDISEYDKDDPDSFEPTLVGCVGTAVAQLLWYWRPDLSAVHFTDADHGYGYFDGDFDALAWGRVFGDAESLDFPDASELNSLLQNVTYSETVGERAVISAAAAFSVMSMFGEYQTGAFTWNIAPALRDTWGFNSAQYSILWNEATKAAAIRNLKQGMPVLVGLSDGWFNDGHQVILEGYDDNYSGSGKDRFKINFGWGGLDENETEEDYWYDLGDPASGRAMPSIDRGGFSFDTVGQVVFDISAKPGWSQANGDSSHTGRSRFDAPATLVDRWHSTPAIANQRYEGMIVGQGAKAYALSSSTHKNQGQPSYLHYIDTQGTKTATASIAVEFEALDGDAQTYLAQGPNGDLYFASTRQLYRFDPDTQQLSSLKTLPSGERFEGAVVIDDAGNIYLRSDESSAPYTNRVYSFTADGAQRWSIAIGTGRSILHDIAVDSARNRVVVPYAVLGDSTGVLMFDAANGSQVGQRDWSGASSSSRLVKAPSIGPDGTIYVARYNELYALNQNASLSDKWSVSTSPGTISHAPTVGRNHLYVAHWVNDTTYALTARSLTNGSVSWSLPLTAGDYDSSMPIVVGANDIVSWVFRQKTAGQDAVYTLYQVQDLGNTFEELDSEYLGTQGGNIVLGPERMVYVVGRDKITALNDGSRGDAYSGGQGYLNNAAPSTADNTGTQDGAIVQGNQVTLSWQSSDPNNHSLTYELYLGVFGETIVGTEPTGALSLVASGITEPQWTLMDLIPDTKYVWQVVTSDGQATIAGPIQTFWSAGETLPGFDFGDAPAEYGTTLAQDGARHLAVGPWIGSGRDVEDDGIPTADSSGDGADDDGLVLTSVIVPGKTATGELTVSGPGYINVWIDAYRNGFFGDQLDDTLDEHFLKNEPVVAGVNQFSIDVPSEWVDSGLTHMRIRFTSEPVNDPVADGPLPDGEVEDYQVQILVGLLLSSELSRTKTLSLHRLGAFTPSGLFL